MIFVTVGAQMPFDRLVRAVDDWAGARGRTDVVAQIGRSSYRPRHLEWVEGMGPAEFRAAIERSDAVVAHAGMGTILSVLQAERPLLVMPRRGDLLETRNDHQLATAERLSARGLVTVAADESALLEALDGLERIVAAPPISRYAEPDLIDAVRRFIDRS